MFEGTHKANSADRDIKGHGLAQLTVEQARSIRKEVKNMPYGALMELAAKYKVSRFVIGSIVRGNTYKDAA